MRKDVLAAYPELDPHRVHVVKNGIDTAVWYPAPPDPEESVLAELGVDPSRPMVAFVGRITRQKGVPHLIAAAHRFHPDVQLVLCAGAPDTPEIGAEVKVAVDALAAERSGVFWVRDFLPVHEIREILSAATAFVCPSVYEPLGIVNLEAMACGTAVVASDVGGIPEVVDDGVTGTLVHYDAEEPRAFEAGLAEAVNALVDDPAKADLVVVNTCAFIDEARKESIDTILALEDQRKDGARLVVTGCMAERYGAPVGVLAKPTHGNIIRLTPPLTISEAEVADALAVLDLALERVAAGDRGARKEGGRG
jgi:glycogen synthase